MDITTLIITSYTNLLHRMGNLDNLSEYVSKAQRTIPRQHSQIFLEEIDWTKIRHEDNLAADELEQLRLKEALSVRIGSTNLILSLNYPTGP